jgi:phosphatidylglycerophosphatase A
MSARADSEISVAPEPSLKTGCKPRFALFVATAGGLGYLPKAPGTFGSLAGLLLAMFPFFAAIVITWITGGFFVGSARIDPVLLVQVFLTLLAGCVGVWAASRAASFWHEKDPQRVVIDEVSGQHLTLLIGLAVPVWWRPTPIAWNSFPLGFITVHSVLNWKYLLLGFILFRGFDIWKPFPAREAESLPGGWGIMADDWAAAVYAGIGLWIARAVGL